MGPYPMEGCCICKPGIGNFGIGGLAIGPCVNADFANEGPVGNSGGIAPLESLPATLGPFPGAADITPSSAGITSCPAGIAPSCSAGISTESILV